MATPYPSEQCRYHPTYRSSSATPGGGNDRTCSRTRSAPRSSSRRRLRSKILYPAEVVTKLAENDGAALIVGLFLGEGIAPGVEDLLLLGADLTLCDGWHKRSKLVAALRSMRGWSGARFEVGIHAGLRRVGLKPIVEPVADKASKAPDFVVPIDGRRVGLELKGIHDPDDERNRHALLEVLGRIGWRFGYEWRNDITLVLNENAEARLDPLRSLRRARTAGVST